VPLCFLSVTELHVYLATQDIVLSEYRGL